MQTVSQGITGPQEGTTGGYDAIVIDGTNLIARAAFAISVGNPNVTAEELCDTTTAMIRGWAQRFGVDTKRTIVCFDGVESSARRRAIFSGYKQGRGDKLPALTQALALIPDHQALIELGGRITAIDYYEADDQIATFAELLDARHLKTLIVSGDKDLLQMVRPRITVANFGQRMTDAVLYTPPVFLERYGFEPAALLCDYKALVGDDSDKIPGVSGVGKGTATKLIQEFGCIEEIYAAGADRIRALVGPAYTDRLLTGYDDAQKFLRIVTLETAVPGVTLRPRKA